MIELFFYTLIGIVNAVMLVYITVRYNLPAKALSICVFIGGSTLYGVLQHYSFLTFAVAGLTVALIEFVARLGMQQRGETLVRQRQTDFLTREQVEELAKDNDEDEPEARQ